MKTVSDSATRAEKDAAGAAAVQKVDRRTVRGNRLLWGLLIFGFLTVGGLLFLAAASGLSQERVTDRTALNPAVPVLVVGILLAVACYMLLKGFSGARFLYAVCMAWIAAGFLRMLLEDSYTLVHNTPELAVLYLVVFLLYLAATILPFVYGGIRDALYDRELKSKGEL